ncbi:FAD-dependent oxidoreductase [Streptomyces sp. CO7]
MERDRHGEVIVVGGGVIGLTTAVVLAESGRRVRLWDRGSALPAASEVAGGLWWPYRIEPEERVGDWSLVSYEVYAALAARPEETGVRMVAGVHGGAFLGELGPWAARVPGLREATPGECPGGGLWARVPLIDMRVHLPWLRERFRTAGGEVERREARSLDEPAAEAPVVVNATGLGARELVPDGSVHPVRGQLVVVENPGVDTWLTSVADDREGSTYFLPQPGRLLLGGTAEVGDWSTEPDPATAEAIVARCAAVRPEIAGARVLEHRVGLRPARPSVRLERETRAGGRVLVHNYGHGGAGVTVAWGCAHEAAALAG